MATFGLLQTLILCFIITTVVSQQPIVSVDEIEDGGTFSVTCDASRMTNIPSDVTDIIDLMIYRQTSQDKIFLQLASYYSSGSGYEFIPSGREWTVDFTGSNNGTNNRNTMKIVIQVSDAVCQDAGLYECYVRYRSVTGVTSTVTRPQCVTSKLVSQQSIVSVDEIEDGGTFSVTCDASRITNIPSGVTDINVLVIYRQTSQDIVRIILAMYSSRGSGFEYITRGRDWTVDFIGGNNGANNRDTMKLVLQVNDAVCNDAGVYWCIANYRSVTGSSLAASRPQCVTSKSAVEDITLYADKYFEVPGRPNYLEYEEGDNINLTCKINGPQELEMKWRTGTYDTVSDLIISDYPYDNDITTFDPTLIANSTCNQSEHMSVLNLRSVSQDVNDQVMYLCVVMENDKSNATEVASTNLTIGVTSLETTTPRSTTTPTTTPSTTTPEHTDGDDDAKEPSSESSPLEIGQIVGIVFGCIAVVVFFAVAIGVMQKKSHKNQVSNQLTVT